MASSPGRRGSVRQAANGSWYFIVDIGHGADRRQTRRRGFGTKREAQANLTQTLTSLERGTYVAPQRVSLGEFLQLTWLPAVEHTIKPGTFESYRRNIRLHLAGRSIGAAVLQEVGPTDLNRLYRLLLEGDTNHRALSPRSVAYVAAILHRAFRDAVRWQTLTRNPADAADPPRPGAKTEMRTWTAAQLRTFLQSLDGDRLAGCWWLLATTGMRRGEVLGLRWEDVDFERKTIRIVRTLITTEVQRRGAPGFAWGTPKTAKGRRTIALDETAVAALKAHRKRQREERLAAGPSYDDQGLVVCQADGSPVHPKTISYQFKKAGRAAGLPTIRLHDLRHTHATLALHAGVHPRIVQERLGHANVSITLDTYSHVDLDLQAAAAARVAALLTAADPTEPGLPEIL